jgi:hypothetical protein
MLPWAHRAVAGRPGLTTSKPGKGMNRAGGPA